MVKNLPANAGDHLPVYVPSLSREDPLEGMSTLSSVLAGKIPWTESLVSYSLRGLQRVRHDLATGQAQVSSAGI